MNKEAEGNIKTSVEKEVRKGQQPHLEKVFSDSCSKFGDKLSYPARKAAERLKKEGRTS